ncbi:MAG: cupin domain-containing protein [Cyclobacteriaceae bacterium]
MPHNAQYWIDRLNMQPHPEGGFYAETYRSAGRIEALDRSYSTGIYFLLLEDKFSAFHRIAYDEMWHFYTGSPVEVIMLTEQGELKTQRLGSNPENGETFQFVVPGGCWFGSRMPDNTSYGLVGCTVAPGFDFRDFEMAQRSELIRQFPQHRQIITEMTYPED